MAKTNFSKAEEAMIDALQKMTKQQLLELTTSHSGNAEELLKRTKLRSLFITTLKHEINRIYRINPEIYKKLNIKKDSLGNWLKDADKLTDNDWTNIVKLREQVEVELKQIATAEPSNDQLVEKERRKHINKRFNVNEKWLPLK